MENQTSRFNRTLLVILVVLYLISVVAFSYANWAVDPAAMEWWMTLLNALIISIPLVLVYGSIYVLVVAWREHTSQGQINPRLAKVIRWAPRLAAMLIIFFISLFSLDVFGMEGSPLELLAGFIMHNLPSLGLILLLVFAWKRPALGFAAFIAAAVLFTFFFVRDMGSLPNLLFFVLPILLVALLFYADWRWVKPVGVDAVITNEKQAD